MKAEYICADHPVTFIFRLRQGGGPYMPVCLLRPESIPRGRSLLTSRLSTKTSRYRSFATASVVSGWPIIRESADF
jgi:hypothetical protein